MTTINTHKSSGRLIYLAGTVERQWRTSGRMNLLDDQIVEDLREDHTQSVRHVIYRITNPRLATPVEKLACCYWHLQSCYVALSSLVEQSERMAVLLNRGDV